MPNLDYSNYNNFIEIMQDLLPCLLKILQNWFNREIASETYSTPTAPKDGQLLKYIMEEGNKEQTISPLSIMVKCIGNLYKAMHNLGCILDFKIEGLIEQQHPIKIETPVSVRADTPVSETNDSNRRLIGCEATPGPTPELSTITNHHLKVLSSLNEKMQWDEHDLLDPRVVSVHAWQCKIFTMLSIVPFAQNILDQKLTTFEDADSMLSSIIMQSFSNKLHTEYFAEHGDRPYCHRVCAERSEMRPMDYEEATGDLLEKVSIVKGKDRTTGKVSHARRGSEFSQEEDQAQEHVSQGRPHGREWDNKGGHTVREGHQIGAMRMVID
ncbi:uncharacterized protein UHOD_11380 [Ustilago sp. UG-2017b]|nr:uncharacterized protein UHOD_11380 [Ustilago sp. UG-2017b]